MIFSVFKTIYNYIYSSDSHDEKEENEEDILRDIEEHSEAQPGSASKQSSNKCGQEESSESQSGVKCFQKTGKITFFSQDYGLIDGEHFFDKSHVPSGVNLKVGDEVTYLSFKAKDNESERVHRIYNSKELWTQDLNNSQANDASTEDKNEEDTCESPAYMQEVAAMSRVINGQVTERRERSFHVSPANIWVDLDQVETSFVPIQGDWVALKAIVSVDEDVTDMTGEVLVIKKVEPLLYRVNKGSVTLWAEFGRKYGVIEKHIYFTQDCCDSCYLPSLGDEVIYEAIESSQGEYKWRAITVTPSEVNKPAEITSKNSGTELLLRDKNGVSILGSTDFETLCVDETKELVLTVKNFSSTSQVLYRGRFLSRRNMSQMRLKSPGLDDRFVLEPNQSVNYVFQCKGNFLGQNSEMFVFTFKNFKIGRIFEMNISVTKEQNRKLRCEPQTVFKKSYHFSATAMRDSPFAQENRKFGERPKCGPKFIRGEKPGFHRIPDPLWHVVLGDGDLPKPRFRLETDLEDYALFLKSDITFSKYAERYHLLLFLEDIAIKVALRRYDMKGVILRRHGEYLVLEVPGLLESRPSLIIGDKVKVTQPWSEVNRSEQIGYIHETRQKDVYIKFHSSFHDSYDESDCDVRFESSNTVLSRFHDAIDRALRVLGEKWLFPTSVKEKPVQVLLEKIEDLDSSGLRIVTDDISSTNEPKQDIKTNGTNDSQISGGNVIEYNIDEEGYLIPKQNSQPENLRKENSLVFKRKQLMSLGSNNFEMKQKLMKKELIWYNRSLNRHQRESVINILKGKGRPLPYIIFGPPGTGKTVTLVETVLQIYNLLPESRILIGTPSNSSADLICERLIDSGSFDPGELVRILAFHRMLDGNVLPKLIPYCTTLELRDEKGELENVGDGIRRSSVQQLVGRHRITIGTCSSLATMHYMGFPKGHFSHIMIDEAGQAMEPELLIPAGFLEVEKGQVILAGDPEQLGPVCISKVAESYGLGISLLQRFVKSFPYARDMVGFPDTCGYDPRFITRLCINYRSVPEILSLPSQMFYNSELVPTVSANEGREADIIRLFNFELEGRDTSPALIFHGVRGQNFQDDDCPSWFNPQEIWEVHRYLKKCYDVGLAADDVGVITPYKKQTQKIRALLDEFKMPVPKIGTVEDFQGQERQVILLSTVRSSLTCFGNDTKHFLGFVASPRRLNVALTRARAILVILGNPHLLTADPYWRSVIYYCVKNNSYLGCDLPVPVTCMLNERENEG